MKQNFTKVVGCLYILTALAFLAADITFAVQSKKLASADDLSEIAVLLRQNAAIFRNYAIVIEQDGTKIQSSLLKTCKDVENFTALSLQMSNSFLETTKKSYKVPLPLTDWWITPLGSLTPYAENTTVFLKNTSNFLANLRIGVNDIDTFKNGIVTNLNSAASVLEITANEIEEARRVRQHSANMAFCLALLVSLCFLGSGTLKILPTEVKHSIA